MKPVRLAIALLIVVILIVAVALALGGGADAPAVAPRATPTSAPANPKPVTPPATVPAAEHAELLTIARTSDPDIYAGSVAALVFSLDTRTFTPGDYRRVLVGEADPLMDDAGVADLERTVGERIPDVTRWARMRANQQWSTWAPTVVWEPDTWAEVVTDGLAEPGWVLRNVTGTQTTSYVDGGQERTAVSEPTVTIGMRCPAPGAAVERCFLTVIGTSVLP